MVKLKAPQWLGATQFANGCSHLLFGRLNFDISDEGSFPFGYSSIAASDRLYPAGAKSWSAAAISERFLPDKTTSCAEKEILKLSIPGIGGDERLATDGMGTGMLRPSLSQSADKDDRVRGASNPPHVP
jgi:hypothetical protein